MSCDFQVTCPLFSYCRLIIILLLYLIYPNPNPKVCPHTCLIIYYCKILYVIKLRIYEIPISVVFHIPELSEMSIPTIVVTTTMSRLLTENFILFFLFLFLFILLFLEQLRLGFISHAVTSVTN